MDSLLTSPSACATFADRGKTFQHRLDLLYTYCGVSFSRRFVCRRPLLSESFPYGNGRRLNFCTPTDIANSSGRGLVKGIPCDGMARWIGSRGVGRASGGRVAGKALLGGSIRSAAVGVERLSTGMDKNGQPTRAGSIPDRVGRPAHLQDGKPSQGDWGFCALQPSRVVEIESVVG